MVCPPLNVPTKSVGIPTTGLGVELPSVIGTSVFASSCSPEFEGVFPAARNSGVLPVGILCISIYPFKSKMLLIVLSRVLV